MSVWATLNAILILCSVWTLAGGDLRQGNWLVLGASVTGVVVMSSAELWPLVGMNLVLFARSAYILHTREGWWKS